MSENRWESIFRQKARREAAEAGRVESEAHEAPAFQRDASDVPLLDPAFSTDICRIDAAGRCLDLLGRMRSSLENIWVSVMIGKGTRPRTFLLCGAAGGEGATFLSFYLSLFMALEHGKRVLYVDTNMAGAPNEFVISERSEGILSFFDKGVDLRSLVCGTEYKCLYVLPGGKGQGRAGVMEFVWRKEQLNAVIAFCRQYFDIAVFDGQPVVFNPAMVEYARAVDQVLLVCRYGQSRREVARLAVDMLGAGGVNLGGVILNAREYPVPSKVYRSVG